MNVGANKNDQAHPKEKLESDPVAHLHVLAKDLFAYHKYDFDTKKLTSKPAQPGDRDAIDIPSVFEEAL